MPTPVRKGSKGGWDIVEDSTGRKVGHSETKKDAEASSRIRNGASQKKAKRE